MRLILVGGITEALVHRVQTLAASRSDTGQLIDDVSDALVRMAIGRYGRTRAKKRAANDSVSRSPLFAR